MTKKYLIIVVIGKRVHSVFSCDKQDKYKCNTAELRETFNKVAANYFIKNEENRGDFYEYFSGGDPFEVFSCVKFPGGSINIKEI